MINRVNRLTHLAVKIVTWSSWHVKQSSCESVDMWSLLCCSQDKRQLERIEVLEAQVANLTSTVTSLSQNMESANTKVVVVVVVTSPSGNACTGNCLFSLIRIVFMCVFLWFILSFFLIVCLSVTVKWLAVKTEMTYTVSGGAFKLYSIKFRCPKEMRNSTRFT